MNEQILKYIKKNKINKNNTYTFSENEIEEFINFINSSTDSLNLFNIPINILDEFFIKYINKLEENQNTVVFETGEFGLLLVNILIDKHNKEKGFDIVETSFREINISTFPSLQYIMYSVGNKNIKIVVNEVLDKNIGVINSITGFPVNSQKLFYVKSY